MGLITLSRLLEMFLGEDALVIKALIITGSDDPDSMTTGIQVDVFNDATECLAWTPSSGFGICFNRSATDNTNFAYVYRNGAIAACDWS